MRPRSIGVVLLALCITVATGLASRRYGSALPEFIANYAGDTLWATMVFWLLALVSPRQRTVTLACAAALIAFCVEVSQLYHAPWIDALRASRLGALVLGYGFLWSDLACYVVGVGIAAAVDLGVVTHRVREK